MKKNSLLTLVLFIHIAVFGQFTIQAGKSKYPSTRTWSFAGSGYIGSVDSKVIVGKIGTGGCLMLSANLESRVQYLRGSITLILDDTVLVLANTLSKDIFDGSPAALYSIDAKQYKILRSKEIREIRFEVYSLSLKRNQFFTSSNLVWHEVDGTKLFLPKYKTSIEIEEVKD